MGIVSQEQGCYVSTYGGVRGRDSNLPTYSIITLRGHETIEERVRYYGTLRLAGKEYLQKYIDEYFFRFNRRNHRESILEKLIDKMIAHKPMQLSEIKLSAI